jgi:hypothetical protein
MYSKVRHIYHFERKQQYHDDFALSMDLRFWVPTMMQTRNGYSTGSSKTASGQSPSKRLDNETHYR